MKILDRYILTTYLKTFLSVFIILMLIFVLQSIWLYISELAGKDLSLSVILKFLLYVTPTLIPLILPLTILLASIMVFGSFAENYEFAAMKSTGISLQRAMRGLSVFILGLAVVTFFFANNVIPWANYNFYNLRKNIAKTQPAMAIAAGQFNEIADYNIKVDKKTGEKGEFLERVYIHKKTPNRTGNYTVITANTGELISSEDSNILQLVLYDGNYYEEIYSKDPKQNAKKPHVRSAFEKYIINVDLEGLNDVDYEEKSYEGRYNMLNVSDLSYTIDSLREKEKTEYNNFSKSLYDRTAVGSLSANIKPKKDSLYIDEVLNLFDNRTKLQIVNLAANTVNSTAQIIKTKKHTLGAQKRYLNQHIISLNEKYVLGIACIILFFVGAPLGALIRKGGIGLPLVIAIVLFLSYHFIGIFSQNSSKNGALNPIFATWLSTLIMLPLSIFLTQRATKDRGLFEFDTVLEPLKKLFSFKAKKEAFDKTYKRLDGFDNDKLIDVIKNYAHYEYDKTVKPVAYQLLLDRGLSTNDIHDKGVVVNDALLKSEKIATDFKDYSLTTIISYGIGAVLILSYFIFRNNKLPELAHIVLQLGIISFVFVAIYFTVSSIVLSKFYKSLPESNKTINYFLLLIGLPFYPITYFLLKNRVKEELYKTSIENIK
ncbi:LptF/LptG family permease [Mangrovimonas sp. YM274]|uniref:LptF/LptG family permease n=1 Tax=Mangrovimonas sp. YM274 TaxID=3070660 RepID=UPI0027DDD1FA|nr:LptF/LptG family permease [Mangrovimonas sp. YM274]WMI70195.1 LptF/LptG family permease [Mangrovimonas sp. YM274]